MDPELLQIFAAILTSHKDAIQTASVQMETEHGMVTLSYSRKNKTTSTSPLNKGDRKQN